MTPTVTVLVDTYNHERFIEEALVSVVEQDFPASEMEILVVDDGSTDGTPEIVRKFGPRVRLLRKENGGQASAFNLGIPEARGEIIAFLDGDDWWARNKLAAVIDKFDKVPEAGMVGHSIIESRPTGEKVISAEIKAPLLLDSWRTAQIFRIYRTYFGTSRLSLRTRIARRVLPLPERLVFEADEYLFTIAGTITRWLVMKEPLTHYRIHGQNLFLSPGVTGDGLRRKRDVLAALESSVGNELSRRGVRTEVTNCLLELISAEAAQLRLVCQGGSRWETIQTERAMFRIHHSNVSIAQQFIHCASLLLASILPPRRYYNARTALGRNPWYLGLRKALVPVPSFGRMMETGDTHCDSRQSV